MKEPLNIADIMEMTTHNDKSIKVLKEALTRHDCEHTVAGVDKMFEIMKPYCDERLMAYYKTTALLHLPKK